MKQAFDMTPKQFQKTFPIVLKEYDPAYPQWYEEEKQNILRAVEPGDVARISHIGSTAVPGLYAKPFVDILLEIDGRCNVTKLLETLRQLDFGTGLFTRSEDPFRLLLGKGFTKQGYAERVFMLHVRYLGDWDELYFRDYLLKHQDACAEYAQKKREILQGIENGTIERMPKGRPNGYSGAKLELVKRITALARQELGDVYKPKG